MRQFRRKVHDALVLDDIRDLKFIEDNQDKLQGKYDARMEFGTTVGGTCAYSKWRSCLAPRHVADPWCSFEDLA